VVLVWGGSCWVVSEKGREMGWMKRADDDE
jgi:hypothetical protein